MPQLGLAVSRTVRKPAAVQLQTSRVLSDVHDVLSIIDNSATFVSCGF